MGQLGGGQFPQLFIYQRQELLGGGRIARLDLRQDLRDVSHDADYTAVTFRDLCRQKLMGSQPESVPILLV